MIMMARVVGLGIYLIAIFCLGQVAGHFIFGCPEPQVPIGFIILPLLFAKEYYFGRSFDTLLEEPGKELGQ